MAHVPGHQDRPKDPLALYTGPSTTGPVQPKRSWLQKAAGVAGDIVYDVTGADNYMEAYRDLQKGNYGGALFNLAQGVGETGLLVAPGLSTGGRAAQAATRVLPRASKIVGVGGGPKSFVRNAALSAGFSAIPDGKDASVPAAQAAPQMVGYTQPQAPEYKVTPYGATLAPREGRQVSPSTGLVTEWNPRTRTYEVVGKQAPSTQAPEGIEQYFDPRSGFNYQWNPTSGIYEVAANTSAVEAPTLSATQQLEFDMARRDIKRETERLLSDLAGRAGSARRETGEQVQTIGRQTAGSSQDIASALAAAGLDTSPGQFDVALEDIAGRGALATAKARKQLSEVLGSIAGQRGRTLEAREQELRDIDALQRAAESDLRRQENERLAQLGLGQGRT